MPIWAIVVLGLVGLGIVYALYKIWPPSLESTEDYFTQYKRGKLTRGVEEKLALVEKLCARPASDFSDFQYFPRMAVKWCLSFTAYGLASIAYVVPDRRARMGELIDKLIQKLYYPICWDDYVEKGYGHWPFKTVNVMYSAHLMLMQLLYYQVTGNTKYEAQVHWMAKDLVETMKKNEFRGMVCQPQNYFTECNTISAYALKLYDTFYGTDHSKMIDEWWKWSYGRLRNPDSGLFYEVYHPWTDYIEKSEVGFNNGWIALFMPVFDPANAKSFYDNFKARFFRKFLWYGWLTVDPTHRIADMDAELGGGAWYKRLKLRYPDGKSSLFGFYSALEFGDREVWTGIARLLAKVKVQKVDTRVFYGIINVKVKGNPAIQAPLLFGQVGVGLVKLLELAKADEKLKRPKSFYDLPDSAMNIDLPPDAQRIADETLGPSRARTKRIKVVAGGSCH